MRIDKKRSQLINESGEIFNPRSQVWSTDSHSGGSGELSDSSEKQVTPLDAVRWLQAHSRTSCPVPVGIVGPREPTDSQLRTAYELGHALGKLRLTVICGGRQGVMEAASKGVSDSGGVVVGLLPDAEAELANPYVTIALATGIGVARNAIIARAAFCLVAIGGGYGTMSECAFALQFNKPVFGMDGAPDIPGVETLSSIEQASDRVARALLRL